MAAHQGAVGGVVESRGRLRFRPRRRRKLDPWKRCHDPGRRRKGNRCEFLHLVHPELQHFSWLHPGKPTSFSRHASPPDPRPEIRPVKQRGAPQTLVTNHGVASDRRVIRHDRPSRLEAIWNRCRSEMLRDRLVLEAPRPAKRNLAGDPCPPPARLGFG